ncbi:hypothetical protein LguiA_001766 [Lonicera macranthoides]
MAEMHTRIPSRAISHPSKGQLIGGMQPGVPHSPSSKSMRGRLERNRQQQRSKQNFFGDSTKPVFPIYHYLGLLRFILAGWDGRDHTGRLIIPDSLPIMPPRGENNMSVFIPEGDNTGSSCTVETPPGPVLPSNNKQLTSEQLHAMLQDITRPLVVVTNNQKAMQACIDALVANQAPTDQYRPPPHKQAPPMQNSSPHGNPLEIEGNGQSSTAHKLCQDPRIKRTLTSTTLQDQGRKHDQLDPMMEAHHPFNPQPIDEKGRIVKKKERSAEMEHQRSKEKQSTTTSGRCMAYNRSPPSSRRPSSAPQNTSLDCGQARPNLHIKAWRTPSLGSE